MLLFTWLLPDLGSQKPSTAKTKTLERASVRQRKTRLRIREYSAAEVGKVRLATGSQRLGTFMASESPEQGWLP